MPDARPFFGFHMPNYTFEGVPPERLFDRVAEDARAAEANGFDMVTVMDHLYQIPNIGPEGDPMLEAYTTLGALAAATSRILLGTLVTGVTYRNPALLAKEVTTLDVVSHGRAILGIGAAWNEVEHGGYGFDFPPIGRRLDRLEEAVAICKAMFTEERPSFEGEHYRIDRARNSPRPLQPGGPKILIGGGGEKRTLRIAARYADITNWFGTIEDGRRKLEILDRHCEAVGRDPRSILRTTSLPLALVADEADRARTEASIPADRRASLTVATVDEAAEMLHEYLEVGFGGFVFRNATFRTPTSIDLAGELIRRLRSTTVAA